MASTKISWSEKVWNPLAGCSPKSAGCLNCYAARMAHRLEAMGQEKYRGLTVTNNGRTCFNGKINLDDAALTEPLHRKKPTMYFVNSMSDLFHEAVPFEFIDKVFAVMALCPQHTFQVLTKRPERMAEYFYLDERGAMIADQAGERFEQSVYQLPRNTFDIHQDDDGKIDSVEAFMPLPNVWLGTSVENKASLHRINKLADCPASVHFVSMEPLLEDLGDIAPWLRIVIWAAGNNPRKVLAIVGGESGPKARPCDVAWIRSIVQQCKAAGVPCFVKQLGAKPMLDGQQYNPHGTFKNDLSGRPSGLYDPKGGNPAEWPEDLRVREMPEANNQEPERSQG